jgi:hypothetical protein
MSLAGKFYIDNVRIAFTKPASSQVNRDFMLDRMQVRAIPVGNLTELIDETLDRTFRGFRISFVIEADVWEQLSGNADYIDVIADAIESGSVSKIFPDASDTSFSIECEINLTPFVIESIRRGTRTRGGRVEFISKGLVNLTNFKKFKRTTP